MEVNGIDIAVERKKIKYIHQMLVFMCHRPIIWMTMTSVHLLFPNGTGWKRNDVRSLNRHGSRKERMSVEKTIIIWGTATVFVSLKNQDAVMRLKNKETGLL